MKTILAKIEATLQKYKMLAPGERILMACSGGADSVALFYLLKEGIPHYKIRLHLIHFDHALRQDSVKDFQFVRELARRHQIPFDGERRKRAFSKLGKNLSPEEAARKMRYLFFKRVTQKTGIRKIALAHHQDDQAETVLMRLLQGTGLRGLQGIRPVMKLEGVTLIRPLMEVSRDEILKFLREHRIPYREDATNQSQQFLRNRIRRRLLPLLEKEFNPKVRQSLCRLAENAAVESVGLDEWVRTRWKTYLRSRRNGSLRIERDIFLALPSALQFRLLDEMLHTLDPRSGLNFESWERIEKGLETGRVRITLPRRLDFHLTSKSLTLKKPSL